ncbi:MAG: 4'-phosphopantetheinyl transferase superfamily protein [Nanoarchaeota archaeon]|nr:4'-phosphopantetheinyl transferase superfamily protein [Nanoarchaeota archaeon]
MGNIKILLENRKSGLRVASLEIRGSRDAHGKWSAIKSSRLYDIKIQKKSAYSLAKRLCRKLSKNAAIGNSATGRPIVNIRNCDLSISHKPETVMAGIIKSPYRIGVDVEYLDSDIEESLFVRYFLGRNEEKVLKKFCAIKNIPAKSGLIIFWSIKESFFKCLDAGLKPMSIRIVDISSSGYAEIACSKSARNLLRKARLNISCIFFGFNERNAYAVTIMKNKLAADSSASKAKDIYITLPR